MTPLDSILPQLETTDVVAAFDADGTIWYGDVSEDFTRWMIDRGEFDDALWPGYVDVNDADPAAGAVKILEFYRGHDVRAIESFAARFWAGAEERRWITPVCAAVRQAVAAGLQTFVVSASPAPVMRPVAALFGVEVLALELEQDAGRRFTGAPRGVVTTGAGKPLAIRNRTDAPVVLAAGNSALDIELLMASTTVAWAINPDDRLRAVSLQRGWRIDDFQS